MVLANDLELAGSVKTHETLFWKVRSIHPQGMLNFRMSNLQAAVGVAQLEKLPETIRKKR